MSESKTVNSLPAIRKGNDPVLSEECRRVDPTSEGSRAVADDMLRVVKSRRDAAGLAAPQIGHTVRIIVVRIKGVWVELFNPEITRLDPRRISEREGCLSYPGFFAPVDRSPVISVRYMGRSGNVWSLSDVQGFEARVIQHEVDHLNGICRVGDAWREASKRRGPKRYKKRKVRK